MPIDRLRRKNPEGGGLSWVINGPAGLEIRLPFYPWKQTLRAGPARSEKPETLRGSGGVCLERAMRPFPFGPKLSRALTIFAIPLGVHQRERLQGIRGATTDPEGWDAYLTFAIISVGRDADVK